MIELPPIDAVPGSLLDAGRHKWAAWMARSIGQPSILAGAPTAEEVLGLADVLLVALEQLPRPELERIWESWESDVPQLSACCSSPAQAAGMAASVFGMNRFDPQDESLLPLVTLMAVADIATAPVDAPESNALLVLSLLARARWRSAGMVRNPRTPGELLELPQMVDWFSPVAVESEHDSSSQYP